jgi:hypothetical protein
MNPESKIELAGSAKWRGVRHVWRAVVAALFGMALTVASAWGFAFAHGNGLLKRRGPAGVGQASMLHWLGSSRLSRCAWSQMKVNRFVDRSTTAGESPEIVITAHRFQFGWPMLSLESGFEIAPERPRGWVWALKTPSTNASGVERVAWRLGSVYTRTSLVSSGELLLPVQPLALGFVGNTFFFGMLCASLLWRRDLRAWNARRRSRCECGYPLQPFDHCPECGKPRANSGVLATP